MEVNDDFLIYENLQAARIDEILRPSRSRRPGDHGTSKPFDFDTAGDAP